MGLCHTKSRCIRPLLLIGICGLSVVGCSPRNDYAPPPPPIVSVAPPIVADVPNYLIETGRTEAVGRSEVRTRISGVFAKAPQDYFPSPDSPIEMPSSDAELIEAGDSVAAGQVLFLVEPDEYEATLASANAAISAANAELESAIANEAVAVAQIKDAEARWARADADFERQKRLMTQNATSQQDYDRAEAEFKSADAALAGYQAAQQTAIADKARAAAKIDQAQAEARQAELDLQYCRVKALISGRLTALEVKEKNYVQSNTVLATIVNDDEIWANFDISDAMVLDFEDQRQAFKEAGPESPLRRVQLQRSGDQGFPFEGYIDYTDSEGFDANSGTLRIRAKFKNADRRLLPGMFVRIRYQLNTYENALLIPEAAVGRDQIGDFVYVIDEEKKAKQVHITLGPKIDEWIAVLDGLTPQSQVVVSGIQRVREGKLVTTQDATDLPAPPTLASDDSATEANEPSAESGTE